MERDDYCPVPAKKLCHGCVIHCTSDNTALRSIQDRKSWDALYRAALIRQHAPLLEIGLDLPKDAVPDVKYHKQCQSTSTMKKLLEAIVSGEDGSSSGKQTVEPRRSMRITQSQSKMYDYEICILCENKTKYLKRDRTREKLVLCQELHGDKALRKAAELKDDERLEVLLNREPVATEGLYHLSCYKSYTWIVSNTNKTRKNEKDKRDEDDAYFTAEKVAYIELFKYIRTEMIPNLEVVPMTFLLSHLEATMRSLGIDSLLPSTKKHLRRRLETEFGESLHIITKTNGKLLVFPDSF